MVGAVGDDAFADEALAGLVANGVELDARARGPDRRRAHLRRPAGRERDRGVSGRERRGDPARGRGRGADASSRWPTRSSSPPPRRPTFFALNASPARVLDLEPDLLDRQPARARGREAREARRRHLRRGGRGALRGRQAGGGLGVRRGSSRSTGPAQATPSRPVSSVEPARGTALRGGAAAGAAWPAPSPPRRIGAQRSLPARDGLEDWPRPATADDHPDRHRLRPGARRRDRADARPRLAGGRAASA